MADKIIPGSGGLAVNFLPNFYKTDANKRFLQATVDQLIQPGTVKKVNGFVGRQYAKATTGKDIFVDAPESTRQNYQLEPGFVVQDTLGNYTYFKDYIDYINQLNVFGGNTKNHARVNKQEYYTWNPHIDWDKFVNFQNYYWLSYGPPTVRIFGRQLGVESTYTIKLENITGSNNQYVFTPDGLTPNPVIRLYRGVTYQFNISSPGNPISIKTARTTGSDNRYTSGIENNGTDNGVITFTVPLDAPTVLYYQSEFDIDAGGVFEVYSVTENSAINVEEELLGKASYTLSNGTPLSNGMKVSFGGQVTPAYYAQKEFYVEGVGTAIKLVDKKVLEVTTAYTTSEVALFDTVPFDADAFGDLTGLAQTPDYIVINRASRDHNPWSRYNRWIHQDVVAASAKYNADMGQSSKVTFELDQKLRAVRPIVEFQADLKLFNFGTTANEDVNLIDDFTTDAFSKIEGTLGYNVDGVPLSEGQKIIFTADTDRLVKNNIYQVQFIDVKHLSSGSRQIQLVKVSEPKLYDVVLVKQGDANSGLMYWFDGTSWIKAQQKSSVNQPPLFDVVDENGASYGDITVYEGSTFKGTKLFSYKVSSTGTADSNLGFALSYKNINNIGDIVFSFNFATDVFQYKQLYNLFEKKVSTGYLVTRDYGGNYVYANGWQTGLATATQAGIRIYKNSNKVNDFNIDIFDNKSLLSDLVVKVFVNGIKTSSDAYSIVDDVRYKKVVFKNDVSLTDVVTIKAYSAQPINDKGFYEIPINLQNNPLNDDLAELTLGEVIDHVSSIVENVPSFTGTYPGISNLRDIGNATSYGTKFVQHSGPASLSLYHVTNQTNNIVRAIEQSRDVYNQFKKNFVSVLENLGVDASPVKQVNLVLEQINKDKQPNFPYYFSDMVPYRASTVSTITVVDGRIKTYPLTNVFSLDELSSKAVGVYVNGIQLVYQKEYTFDSQGFVVISAELQENDIIDIYEYESTDGSFVPETPTKLGLWQKYEPKIYLDTSLITPRWMIQGHDGSQVLAYGTYDTNGTPDYRDAAILELEKRIFNNIKVEYNVDIFDIDDVVPNYLRRNDYTLSEFNDVIAPSFYKWTSLTDRDFSKPLSYDRNNPFTYNYENFIAPDGTALPGYWRGIYRYLLGTDRPHICPWEMLGLTIEPSWWVDRYGPAPYTSDNKVMWEDISNGVIRNASGPATVNLRYVRPYLLNRLPVDSEGNLISPSTANLARGTFTNSTSAQFKFGDVSPVEAAWRRSSFYPFSVILASMLLTPSKTFGTLLDRSRIVRNLTGQLVYKDTGLRIKPSDIVLPSIYSSSSRVQTSGIINYLVNYILSDNLKSYNSYFYDLQNITSKLSYRVGAFTSKEKFNLLLDSKSPLSTGNVFVPQENYVTILNSSSPVRKITYSGVIITKIQDKFEVKGYSKVQPYFKYYNYTQSGTTVNVGGISEAYVSWAGNQTYVVGKIVKYTGKYYRATSTHTTSTDFEPKYYQQLSELPVIGGRSAIFRKSWNRLNPITVPYGTVFSTIQEVVDFLLGYGEWLKDEGFVFDEFNYNLKAVTNWETSAKEFLFWTTQNWGTGEDKWAEWRPNQPIEFQAIVRYNGDYYQAIREIASSPIFDEDNFVKLEYLSSAGSSVISLSPAADKIIFKTGLSVVDDIRNQFNGYEIYKVDGTPLEAIFINSYREDNAVSYSPRNADGIYGATFYLIQHEHVIILDNNTMFNDTLYNPSSGYKQDRIKVSGYVSTDWYGGFDIPGFILDVAKIQEWAAWEDYDLGDIVKYKQFFYTASKFLPGAELFNDNDWIKLEKKPETSLLPNFNYKVTQFLDFYSLDSDNFDKGQQTVAQHLVGYQKRQYLENIIQDDVSEFKFYQGMIKEKGTQNSLNKLFDVLSSADKESLAFTEEWAIRVGQYGASAAYENIEFSLDEAAFRNNPQGFELTSDVSSENSNFIIKQNPNQIYLKPLGYNNNPWPVINNYKPYLRSAGYVRPSEVFLTLSNISDIVNQDITTFINGAYVWVTFDGPSWNVFRYTNFDVNVIDVTYDKPSKVLTIETDKLVTFKVGSYIGLSQVSLLQGFYQVTEVTLNSFKVSANITGNFPTTKPFPFASQLVVYGFISQRVSSIDNVDALLTKNLIQGEQIWADSDASGKWSTWNYNKVYGVDTVPGTDPVDGLNFGRSIAVTESGNILAIGSSEGEIQIWDRPSLNSSWILRQVIQRPYVESSSVNSKEFFSTQVVLSKDGKWLATGSPYISEAKTKLKGLWDITTAYSVGDVVLGPASLSGTRRIYKSLQAQTGQLLTNLEAWQEINFISTDSYGNSLNLTEHGVVSLYRKDANNIYSLISTFVSPDPVAYEHFGYNLFFGVDRLYVTSAGDFSDVNRVSKVYSINYESKSFWQTAYNPVGSSGTTLAVMDSSGVLPGMTLTGTGFTSGQIVTSIVSPTKITLSSAPDSTPAGIIVFSYIDWWFSADAPYSDNAASSNFGHVACISKDNGTLAISSTMSESLGKVYIYKGTSTTPVQEISETTATVNFGKSLSLSNDGTYLVISDDLASTEAITHQGVVNIYKLNETTEQYELYHSLTNYLPEESGYFGSKVSFMNDHKTLVVFSENQDTYKLTGFDNHTTTFDKDSTIFKEKFVDSGRVDVYDLYASKWVYSETLDPIPEVNTGFGTGFAVASNKVIVSAPYSLDVGSTISVSNIIVGRTYTIETVGTTDFTLLGADSNTAGLTFVASSTGTGTGTVVEKLISGKVYDYSKKQDTFSWQINHREIDKPDVYKIKTAFLYNKSTGKLVTYLDVIDPAQGKIPGAADEEIKHKAFYDPATYSYGTDGLKVDNTKPWGKNQVGQLWWDLRTAKFINSYDNDILYRTSTWNTLATGATIDIYEWVESKVLPDAWDKQADTEAGLAAGISGKSLYGNSVYSERVNYDSIAQAKVYTYYFWVKNKKTIPNVGYRHLSAYDVSNLISNPRGYGYTYLALTGSNSFSLVNSKQYLEGSDIVLSVEYWTIDKTDQNVHSQWKIINGQSSTDLPSSVEIKWVDSLCGKDLQDRVIPDPALPPKLRYGIENRPRQSMFVNRFEALKQVVEQANLTLSETPVVESKDISQLNLYDAYPSLVTGLYDTVADVDTELKYINIGAYRRPTLGSVAIEDGRILGVNITYAGRGYIVPPYINFYGTGQGASGRAVLNEAGQISGIEMISSGEGYDEYTVAKVRDFSVLVYSDTGSIASSWSIYSYDPSYKVWSRVQSQKYDVRNYWSKVDWYASGYNQFTAIDFTVDTLANLLDLSASIGQVVKVKTVGTGGWNLLEKYADINSLDWTQSYKVVGIENGTIELSKSLYQAESTNVGFDGTTYDSVVYDNAPATELRIILNSLKNDIFIDDLKTKYLQLFLTTVRYALTEQLYVDWIFKTSFIKANHNLGSFEQHVTYKSDNLSNFQDYIEEVKPYKTKVREYISSYDTVDNANFQVSDFDLPPVYSNGDVKTISTWISHGKIETKNAFIQQQPWATWYSNAGYSIVELKIIDGGSGYIGEPVVRIISNSGTGAIARAYYANGKVNRIILVNPGSGYLEAPTVEVVGGLAVNGTPATVVAIIGDGLVRSNKIGIKFDRVSSSYYIIQLEESETFVYNPSQKQYSLKWAPNLTLGKYSVSVDGIQLLNESYSLSVVTSTSKGFTEHTGLLTIYDRPASSATSPVLTVTYYKDVNLLSAADRIQYFYNPEAGMIGKDLSQLMTGVDYGGVIVTGLGFEESSGWGILPYFTDKWDGTDPSFTDYIKTVSANTYEYTLPYVPAAGEEINIYYRQFVNTEFVSDGVSIQYAYDIFLDTPVRYDAYREVAAGGINVNYVYEPSNTNKRIIYVTSTEGIQPEMFVVGSGFNSNQKVEAVLDSTRLLLNAEWNTLPTGSLLFTFNTPGTTNKLKANIYKLELTSTEGVKVGDRVEMSAVAAFNYETYVTEIVDSKFVKINQIILNVIPAGATIKFSRSLSIPTDLRPFTGSTIILTQPITAGTVISINGYLPGIRLDDPAYGTPEQTNSSAIMETFIGDGVNSTITLPMTIAIGDADQIIIRKSTSDGSIVPQEVDYDTSLSGGAFSGNYDTGTHTSATGYAADDIILDGDGLVTETSSPAPEEVVPGQVVDTVAIKVFDQPYSRSAKIAIDNFIGDGSTTSFVLSQRPNSTSAIIVKLTTGTGPDTPPNTVILSVDDDYTFNYRLNSVELNTPATAGAIISIYSVGFNGSKILDLDYFVGDGVTTEFITKAKWIDEFNSLIYIDGVPQTSDLFRTDDSYDTSDRVAFRFGEPPAAGAIVNFIIVAGSEQTYAITRTEKVLTNGNMTYTLSHPIGTYLPNETSMIVRVNNTILQGPINSYFTIQNNKLNYKLDASKVLPYSTAISSINVYVDATKLQMGRDYTIDASGITIKLNKITYNLYYKKTLVISVTTGQGYSYDPSTNVIEFSQAYQSSDLVEVVSSYKHNILDIQRTQYTVSSSLSVEADTLEYYNYKGLVGGRIPLDRPVLKDSYIWVLLNNDLLVPSIDYKLLSDNTTIQLNRTISVDDKVTLITFGTNVLVPNISYMQFKDMLNRVHFKRLSSSKRTRLFANLSYNDTTIRIENGANFGAPNIALNKPGIIEINGERIEYFSLTTISEIVNGNPVDVWVLGKLRRGTLGTGTPSVHYKGSFVQDIGHSETIPYVEKSVVEQIISDGSQYVPLQFTPMKGVIDAGHTYVSTADWDYAAGYVSSIPSNYIQADDIEVFVGGYVESAEWSAGVTYKEGDIVTVGSYKYRCLTAHTSSDNFRTDYSNWTFFIGNIRLKKEPYKVHNVNQAQSSPEGDMQLDADFAVDGNTNTIYLTNKLSLGTHITVVKRTGVIWDSTTNIMYDNSKIAQFLRAEPGIWYEAYRQTATLTPSVLSWDETTTTFDTSGTTFDQG